MSNDLHLMHRPTTFAEVIGQDGVVKSLKGVLKQGTSHAFIFTGPSGVGKTTLARIIATTVGCDTRRNLLEVDAATHTGIEAMRDLTTGLVYSGLGENPTKVVIIDEAHALSKAAWQSLLKPIEEPPRHVWWCLCTTEPSKIPDTIKTRCVVYELQPVKTAVIFEHLKSIMTKSSLDIPEDVLFVVAERAQGSPRLALTSLATVLRCKTRQEAAALLKASGDEGDVINLCRALYAGGLTWAKAVKLLEPIADQNPEGIRLTISAYFTKVLMGTSDPKKAADALNILGAFATPYPNAPNLSPVMLSLGELIYGN